MSEWGMLLKSQWRNINRDCFHVCKDDFMLMLYIA